MYFVSFRVYLFLNVLERTGKTCAWISVYRYSSTILHTRIILPFSTTSPYILSKQNSVWILYLNTIAHEFLIYCFRQFNIVLKEDPASVFSPDIEIENTLGPLYYDLSRVYSGTLEGK